MKIIPVLFLCLLFSLNAFAQTDEFDKNAAATVEEIVLARDDGSGQAGDKTDKFLTTDVPIHCFIQLSSLKPTTVKLILVAVKAVGLKPETKSVSVSYTTNGAQNQVNFNASPDKVWAAGSYRADVFINGKLTRSQTFEIAKSANEIEKVPAAAPKSFAPRRAVKKPRKN